MKANSNTIPETFIKSKTCTHFNFNIVETTKEEMDGESRISFDYDYVEIEGEVTRDKLISAIIRDRYSKDAELALLHNKIIGKDVPEYDEYQEFRAVVKTIADAALETYHENSKMRC